MPVHTVELGENLLTLAARFGFSNWETIYFHEENETLRDQRPDPFVLDEGDEVFIPPKAYDALETGRSYLFRLHEEKKVPVSVVLYDYDDTPLAGRSYKLLLDDLPAVEGTTSPDGIVQTEVPPGTYEGTLEVEVEDDPDALPEVWPVALGVLDPVNTVEGVQDRLINLGYLEADERSDDLSEVGTEALKQFQIVHHLKPSGNWRDEATQQHLDAAHASGDRRLRFFCTPGKRYTFTLPKPQTIPLTLTLEDYDGQPLDGRRCELITDTGSTINVKTDADGTLTCEVPAGTSSASLKVWVDTEIGAEPETWTVDIESGLDPPDTPLGAQDRLVNLGYLDVLGAEDHLDEEAQEALRAFQEYHDLEPTGVLDELTQALLVQVNGA